MTHNYSGAIPPTQLVGFVGILLDEDVLAFSGPCWVG